MVVFNPPKGDFLGSASQMKENFPIKFDQNFSDPVYLMAERHASIIFLHFFSIFW